MPGGDVLISRLITAVMVDLGQSEARLRTHKQQLEETQAAGKGLAQSTQEIGERSTQLRAKIIELSSELGGLRGRLRDLEQQSASLGPGAGLAPHIEETRLQMGRLQGEIANTRGELRNLGQSAQESGQGFESGAIGIGKYFTALIAVQQGVQIIKGQAEAFGEFDQALVHTTALTNTTREEIAKMTPAIRQLAVETGRPLAELGQALYSIESSGAQGADGLILLEAAAKGASIGMGQSQEIARVLTQSMVVYGLTAKEAAGLMDSLTVAVKEGSSEATDYARNIGQVLPSAQRLGISFQEVAASLAVMSLAEQNGARNATSLKQVLQELDHPGEQAKKALDSVGLSSEQLVQIIKTQGLPAALKDLASRTEDYQGVLGAILPDVRAFTGFLRLTGEQADKYTEIVDKANNSTGQFAGAIDEAGNGVVLQTDRMSRGFENLGSAMAEKVKPIVLPLAEGIANGLTPAVEKSGEAAEKAAQRYDFWAGVLRGLGQNFGQHISDPNNIPLIGPIIDQAPQAIQDLETLGKAIQEFWNSSGAPGIGTRSNDHGLFDAQLNQQSSERQLALIQQAYAEQAETAKAGSTQLAQAVEEGGNRVQRAYNAALEFDRQQELIGQNGQKLIKAIDEFVQKPFDKGGQQALQSAAQLQQKIQEAWRTGLDPQQAEAQITRLTGAITELINAEGDEAKAAARNAILGILVEFGQGAEDDRVNQRVQQRASQQRAEQRRQQQEAEREAREAKDRLIGGLVSDIESRRQQVEETYGRVGDSALSTFVSALSGARSGQSTEPILQAQARLAQQLKTAGVEDWQQAAERVGQAYLQALAGTMSGSQAAEVLVGAIGEVPRLSPETFTKGLDREALLTLGGNSGRHLAEGIETGFKEGGQKAIAEVQRSTIALLRETEKITDPELAARRSREFWQQVTGAIREGTPEALAALEEYTAQWNRQIQLDVAQQEYTQKVRDGAQENVRRILEAKAEANRQIGELTRGVGEERGTSGLESFREHMRQALGEETDLFRRVSESIDEQQAQLGGAQGFRQARENFQRLMDDRADAFREEQYHEQTIFQEGEDSKRRELQHTREEEDVNRRHGREDAAQSLSLLRENQDVSRRQQREEAEAQRQLNRELAAAGARGASGDEIAGIRSRFTDSKADRDRQRQFDTEDRNLARTRAQEDLAIRRGAETIDRAHARSRETEDVQIQKESRQRQHEFELAQAQQLRAEQRETARVTREFEDQQSDQRLGHQIRNLDAERQKRIDSANETFAELLKKETEHRDNVEQQVNRPAWREMLRSFEEEFYDPAQNMVDQLISSALGPNRDTPGDHEQAQSVRSTFASRGEAQGAGAQASNEPLEVRLPPDQIADIAAAANDHPIEMDGEDVEGIQSRIRRERTRSRTLS